jgi:uncharacterized membrane protein
MWCGALLAAPLCAVDARLVTGPSGVLYGFFHLICHQIPERSFFVFGRQVAVCMRCSSVYFAFLLGTIIYPLVRSIDHPAIPGRSLLLAAAIPLIADGLSLGFLLYDVNALSRTLTGFLFGIVLPFYIIPAAQQGISELLRCPQPLSIHQQKGLSDA